MPNVVSLSVLSSAPAVMPRAFDPPGFTWETFFPLAWLAAKVGADVATNQWVQIMESLWAGALWMVQFTFKLVDAFTTPDLSEGGPMAAIYPATFAIGGALALVLAFVQIGFAAFQRSGQGLARVAGRRPPVRCGLGRDARHRRPDDGGHLRIDPRDAAAGAGQTVVR